MGSIPDLGRSTSTRLTYEDYLQLPEDRNRYEILDGDLEVTPSPTTRHQAVSRELLFLLHGHVRKHALGQVFDAPTDVILADTTVVVPDLLFVRAGRASIIQERGIEGPPDLVVEILSPSTSKRDREAKAKLYARYGVGHYWIVDPEERSIELHELEGESYRLVTKESGDATLRPTLFPGLVVSLSTIWT